MVHPMPPEDCRHLQHGWDKLLYEHHFLALLNSVSDATSSESGVWLDALPAPSLGTKVNNESLRIALGLRLGVPIVEHTCICGAVVDVYASHGLSCMCGGDHISQHAAVNGIVRHALVSEGLPAVLKPVGVCRNDGKRPDGMSLIPWRQGLLLLWDFTCSDTLSPSNVSTSSRGSSRLANSAESAKFKKYSSLSFSPSLC